MQGTRSLLSLYPGIYYTDCTAVCITSFFNQDIHIVIVHNCTHRCGNSGSCNVFWRGAPLPVIARGVDGGGTEGVSVQYVASDGEGGVLGNQQLTNAQQLLRKEQEEVSNEDTRACVENMI